MADVTVGTGFSLFQQQSGTLSNPTNEFFIKFQSKDSTKAPFGAYFPHYVNTPISSSVVDSIMSFGYNPDLGNSDVSFTINFEQDYEVALGTHIIEHYIQYVGTNHTTEIRPLYYNVDKSTNVGLMQINLVGPTHQGNLTINSGDQTRQYVTIDDSGFTLKNNWQMFGFDGSSVKRNLFYLDSGGGGGHMVVGDLNNSSTFIRGRTNGILNYSSGSFQVLAADGGGRMIVQSDNSITMYPASGTPATPPTGCVALYVGSDGKLKGKDATGVVHSLW